MLTLDSVQGTVFEKINAAQCRIWLQYMFCVSDLTIKAPYSIKHKA